MEERKPDEFEDDREKWKIFFDIPESPMEYNSSLITIRIRKNNDKYPYLTQKDIERLKQDLKDLGKFRIIKQGKEFLEK